MGFDRLPDACDFLSSTLPFVMLANGLASVLSAIQICLEVGVGYLGLKWKCEGLFGRLIFWRDGFRLQPKSIFRKVRHPPLRGLNVTLSAQGRGGGGFGVFLGYCENSEVFGF